MDNFLFQVVNYFRTPKDYFWRWAEKGQVIEWKDGTTLCYREDIIPILQALAPEGLPPFGSILLALAAMKDDWQESAEKAGILRSMLPIIAYQQRGKETFEGLKDELSQSFQHLDSIQSIDKKLRSGAKRATSLYTIFNSSKSFVPHETAVKLLQEFNSGRLDRYIFKEGIEIAGPYFEKDLGELNVAMTKFSSHYQLEIEIRTGVKKLPIPAELEVPDTQQADLLEQLAQDPKTAGIANLTKHLIAALHIPMHAYGSSDQQFGGVSDISNRGNFDRLLLSELAHDDISLMARLANNEALYLRREEMPDDLNKQRYILMDTSLKMWGTPRVFAMAAALACTRNNNPKAAILAFALGGEKYQPIDLSTKEGVIKALEQQDVALDCSASLTRFMSQASLQTDDEYFLVVEAAQVHSAAFQHTLAALKKPLSFLVTVNRQGDLQFFQFMNGHRKPVSEARFDIPRLLTPDKRPVTITGPQQLPAMFYCEPFALYFPSAKLKFTMERMFNTGSGSVLAITLDRRILYWAGKEFGALELLDSVEDGYYCFGLANSSKGYLLVRPSVPGDLILYQFYFDSRRSYTKKLTVSLSSTDITGSLSVPFFADIYFDNRSFNIKFNTDCYAIDADTGDVTAKKLYDFVKPGITLMDFNHIRRIVNNGYSVLNNIKSIYVNDDDALSIDNRQIRLVMSDVLKLLNNKQGAKKKKEPVNQEPEVIIPFPGCGYKLLYFRWADGSTIFIDSRGFLHLQSTDRSLAEITIVLVIERATACWASDNTISGSNYFTGETADKKIKASEFYLDYIQPFIDKLY